MGTWGEGNFESDAALDFISEEIDWTDNDLGAEANTHERTSRIRCKS